MDFGEHALLIIDLLGSILPLLIAAVPPADRYSSTEVIATDIQPIQPGNVPTNLKFLIDDFEDEWGYETQPFDYVHARYLATCVKDWPRLMKQAYEYVVIIPTSLRTYPNQVLTLIGLVIAAAQNPADGWNFRTGIP